MRPRLVRAALVSAALGLAAPAAAHATLVYTKVSKTKGSVWIANDDGSGARQLAANADLARISPDGQTVAYVAGFISAHPALKLVPAAGGTARTVVRNWSYGTVSWSPDSKWLVALANKGTSAQRLVLVEAATGVTRTLATGQFSGASFSPDSTRVVYGMAPKQALFWKTNLYVTPVAAGDTQQLTTDNHSQSPLWGPTQIAYTRYTRPTGKHRHDDGPKYNLLLIDPATGVSRQLTHDKVPFLLSGLTPAIWSLDGLKLVATFGGQDTYYGVKVDPATGAEKRMGTVRQGRGKLDLIPAALSKDGLTILAYTGFLEAYDGSVYTVPYAGGTPTRIVKHAINPDWTG